jgi:hypothetical protein
VLKPDEIIPVSVGELYRYRLAVQDQLLRVEAATQAMRARRDQIERDEEELLIGPSTSMEAFREQLEEIRRSEVPEWWRLKTEAEFLAVAVYGIVGMAKSVRAASIGDMNSCVQRAIDLFEKAAPDADLFRHLHEHVDAYMRGKGKDAHRPPGPRRARGSCNARQGPRLLRRGEAVRSIRSSGQRPGA